MLFKQWRIYADISQPPMRVDSMYSHGWHLLYISYDFFRVNFHKIYILEYLMCGKFMVFRLTKIFLDLTCCYCLYLPNSCYCSSNKCAYKFYTHDEIKIEIVSTFSRRWWIDILVVNERKELHHLNHPTVDNKFCVMNTFWVLFLIFFFWNFLGRFFYVFFEVFIWIGNFSELM